MAKKKKTKRSADEYQKPVVKKAADTASSAVDSATGAAGAAGAAAAGTATAAVTGAKSAAAKADPKARQSAKNSDRGKSRGGRGGSSGGVSANTQWAILGGGIAAIVLGLIVFSYLAQTGGSGVIEVNAWDLPAKAGDTDGVGPDDGRIALSDLTGTPTVLNFFASWCESCDRELPYFTQIAETYADQIDFVFVNANDGGDWRDMADRHDIIGRFPVASDIQGTNRNGLLRNLGGGTGMPATAFYNADGTLESFTGGEVSAEALLNRIQELGVVTG